MVNAKGRKKKVGVYHEIVALILFVIKCFISLLIVSLTLKLVISCFAFLFSKFFISAIFRSNNSESCCGFNLRIDSENYSDLHLDNLKV